MENDIGYHQPQQLTYQPQPPAYQPDYQQQQQHQVSYQPYQPPPQQQQQQAYPPSSSPYGQKAAAGLVSPRAAVPTPPSRNHATYVLALYDYDAQAEGDLSFKKDDKIELVERTQDANDWWTGKLRGVIGVFPGKSKDHGYIQEIKVNLSVYCL
jgi:amphiphysin